MLFTNGTEGSLMVSMNKLYNLKNPFQGTAKKVLCLCSAGLLRSPTAALVLSSEPFNFNTRAAGVNDEYALITVDEALLAWADEIVVMEIYMKMDLLDKGCKKPIICLDIKDDFDYRDPVLVELIKMKYKEKSKGVDIVQTKRLNDSKADKKPNRVRAKRSKTS